MHGVVYFSGWWLVQRLSGFQGKWAIFGAVVGFTVVVHVVLGFHSVFASTPTVAMIWSSTPLAIWGGCMIEGPWVSFLRRWFKILLPVLSWPATIRVDTIHMLGVAVLIIIVTRSCSFVWF
jgi:hypothetical protein